MKRAVACLFLVPFCAHLEGQAQIPRAVPLFSNIEQRPAFMLECVNTSAARIPATEFNLGLKVDGKEIEHGTGGSFSGGVPVFQPGQTWRVLLWLGSSATHGSNLSANLSMAWGLPLETGRHTLAFRCVSAWSEEIAFYWDAATVPQ